jgi:hypothetical protein
MLIEAILTHLDSEYAIRLMSRVAAPIPIDTLRVLLGKPGGALLLHAQLSQQRAEDVEPCAGDLAHSLLGMDDYTGAMRALITRAPGVFRGDYALFEQLLARSASGEEHFSLFILHACVVEPGETLVDLLECYLLERSKHQKKLLSAAKYIFAYDAAWPRLRALFVASRAAAALFRFAAGCVVRVPIHFDLVFDITGRAPAALAEAARLLFAVAEKSQVKQSLRDAELRLLLHYVSSEGDPHVVFDLAQFLRWTDADVDVGEVAARLSKDLRTVFLAFFGEPIAEVMAMLKEAHTSLVGRRCMRVLALRGLLARAHFDAVYSDLQGDVLGIEVLSAIARGDAVLSEQLLSRFFAPPLSTTERIEVVVSGARAMVDCVVEETLFEAICAALGTETPPSSSSTSSQRRQSPTRASQSEPPTSSYAPQIGPRAPPAPSRCTICMRGWTTRVSRQTSSRRWSASCSRRRSSTPQTRSSRGSCCTSPTKTSPSSSTSSCRCSRRTRRSSAASKSHSATSRTTSERGSRHTSTV